MIGVVYLGSNPETEERLKYIPGRLVQYTKNYKEAAAACSTHVRNEHFIVFFEQAVLNEDITAITYLKKKSKGVYIILLTHELSNEDRKMYQKCGINDTVNSASSITDLNKKITFIADRENILFDDAGSSRFLFGNASSTFVSPCWPSFFYHRYSSSPPLPSVWRARDQLSSSQSV